MMTEAVARANRAVEERAAVIRLAQRLGDRDIVDSKGVGQPFKFTGEKDQDFSEWSRKTRTFVMAKFGDKVERAMKWAAQQGKIIAAEVEGGDDRKVGYDAEFGSLAPDAQAIENAEKVLS